MKQAVGVFRGSNAKINDINVTEIPQHGSGKHYDISDAERLFENLLIEQAFTEIYVSNGSGFSSAYIQVRSLFHPKNGSDGLTFFFG